MSSKQALRQWHWHGCAPAKERLCRSWAPAGSAHLEDNLAAVDVTLTTEHLRTLDAVSTPTLNYPADVNGATRSMLQFAGSTVDGEPSTVYPPLLQSDVRY